MNAMGPYCWEANIGSGNGLVPSGNKPIPEPMLNNIYVTIWCQQATMCWTWRSLKYVTVFIIELFPYSTLSHHPGRLYKHWKIHMQLRQLYYSLVWSNNVLSRQLYHSTARDYLLLRTDGVLKTSLKISHSWGPQFGIKMVVACLCRNFVYGD